MKLSLKDFTELSNLFAVPIFILNPKTVRVIYCNEYFEELTGKTVDQVKDNIVYDLFSAQNDKKIDAIISLASGDKNLARISEKNLEIKRRSGRKSPVDVYCKAVRLTHGKVLVFSLLDLSEIKEKQAEREFLINQNLRSAKLADLGRLAQGIAHELNNPLSIIMGNIDLLTDLNDKKEVDTAAVQKILTSVSKNSQRMSLIVRKLLNFYKTEDINFKEASSVEIIREIINESEYYLNFNKIILYIDLMDVKIVCDSLHIKQVLANLMKNAITAIESVPSPKMITIRSEEIVGEYVISINNSGLPINDEIRNKIFTPFFTTKDVNEGAGLSLYLSEKIMKIHHGSLSFESNSTAGTTFYLHFPKAAASLNPQTEAQILIVSQENSFRTFLTAKLEVDKFKIIEAQNLAYAKNLFHYPLSAIIIDAMDAEMFKSSLFNDLVGLNTYFPIILFYPPELDLKLKFLKTNNLYFYPTPMSKTDYESMIQLITQKRLHNKKAS